MLTQFISDTLGKDFAEADDIKHRFFAEEDALDEESSAVRLMQTSVSNFTRRFAREVNRSIVMYRRQKAAMQLSVSLLQVKALILLWFARN